MPMVTNPSGLQYKDIVVGTGPSPFPGSSFHSIPSYICGGGLRFHPAQPTSRNILVYAPFASLHRIASNPNAGAVSQMHSPNAFWICRCAGGG
eukprot:437548-Pyramimonas_sp.AAC.1